MTTLLNVDVNHSEKILHELSSLKTTFFKINPLLDNKALIQSKIHKMNLKIFRLIEQDKDVGLFLFRISNHNKSSAYIDAIFNQSEVAHCEDFLIDFIRIISSIYNIKSFIKLSEINDNRIFVFEKIGFKEAAVLRENLFYDGYYQDQALYFLQL
ncbi:hypothetical protein J32TS6_17070 [Virgibacillus pantothenticus]|nr:hypothetical protein [Virgibacillus pantothenticus]GIP63152.1 hypothetical protein J32TS6_17070 [Virgibacillus pantothenticus]